MAEVDAVESTSHPTSEIMIAICILPLFVILGLISIHWKANRKKPRQGKPYYSLEYGIKYNHTNTTTYLPCTHEQWDGRQWLSQAGSMNLYAGPEKEDAVQDPDLTVNTVLFEEGWYT